MEDEECTLWISIQEELAKRSAELKLHVQADTMPERNNPLLTKKSVTRLRNGMPVEGKKC